MTKKERFFKNNREGYNTTQINYSGYGYGRHYAGMTNIYGYDLEGDIFDYIVTNHRAKVIAKMLNTGEWWTIDEDIRTNYSTNGYLTRVGIKRANIKRIRKIAESHKVIFIDGKIGHDLRVVYRKETI